MSLNRICLAAVVAPLAACAADTGQPSSALYLPVASAPGGPAGAASVPAAKGGYTLTEAEGRLDCPRLTGQMKVRIANMRAAYGSRSGTGVSQTIQSVVTPVFGGTTRGLDPDADLQLDRAKLEAFNRRLAEKKCRTLDLDAELRGEPSAPVAGTKG